MSLERYNGRTKEVTLLTETASGEEKELKIKVRPVSTKQFLRLLGIFQKLQTKLGFTQEEVEKLELNPSTVRTLAEKVVNACVGEVDLGDSASMGENAAIVFTELSAIFKVDADELASAALDDTVELLVAFWEVNSSGPLGQRVRATIAKFRPHLEEVMTVIELNFRSALMRALPRGGTTDGGTITSSPQSTNPSTGQNETSSSSTSSDSSTSSEALTTSGSSSEPTMTQPPQEWKPSDPNPEAPTIPPEETPAPPEA